MYTTYIIVKVIGDGLIAALVYYTILVIVYIENTTTLINLALAD